jgi:hypothetical protein
VYFLDNQMGNSVKMIKARFSEVGWGAGNVFLAPLAAAGGSKSAQLSCVIGTGEGDGSDGMRLGGQPDRLD